MRIPQNQHILSAQERKYPTSETLVAYLRSLQQKGKMLAEIKSFYK
jgi:hypothetical protein